MSFVGYIHMAALCRCPKEQVLLQGCKTGSPNLPTPPYRPPAGCLQWSGKRHIWGFQVTLGQGQKSPE